MRLRVGNLHAYVRHIFFVYERYLPFFDSNLA